MMRPASLGAHAFGAHGSSACASILRSTRIHLSLLATALTESRPRTSNEHTWVLSVRLPNNTTTRSRDADLRLQEREASCGERRGIILSAVIRLPHAVSRRRLDRTQNDIGDHCCSLRGPHMPSPRDLAAPDQDEIGRAHV